MTTSHEQLLPLLLSAHHKYPTIHNAIKPPSMPYTNPRSRLAVHRSKVFLDITAGFRAPYTTASASFSTVMPSICCPYFSSFLDLSSYFTSEAKKVTGPSLAYVFEPINDAPSSSDKTLTATQRWFTLLPIFHQPSECHSDFGELRNCASYQLKYAEDLNWGYK